MTTRRVEVNSSWGDVGASRDVGSDRDGPAGLRRLLRAAALVVSVILLSTGCTSGPAIDILSADASGGFRASLVSSPLDFVASPGTFRAGQQVEIRPAPGFPEVPGGRALVDPVVIMTDGQPASPVLLQPTRALNVDPGLALAVLWDPETGRLAALPWPDADQQVRLPRLGGVGWFGFDDTADRQAFLGGAALDGSIEYLKDFFNAAVDCPLLRLDTDLLDVGSYPGTVGFQLDVNDARDRPDTVALSICNPLRFVRAFEARGAGRASGFAFPRSAAPPVYVLLEGEAGDEFVVDASFTPESFTLTMMFFALGVMPHGGTIVEQVVEDALLGPDSIALAAEVTRTCASSISAALRSTGSDGYAAAIECVTGDEDFVDQVIDIWAAAAVSALLETPASAAELVPQVRALVTYQAIQRLALELTIFGAPQDATFPHELRCSTGRPCGPRPLIGGTPTDLLVVPPADPPVVPPTDPPVVDGGAVADVSGDYRLSVAQSTCVGLDDCSVIDGEELGVQIRVSGCAAGSCTIVNTAGVWAGSSALVLDGDTWTATGTETADHGFYCFDRPRPTAFRLDIQVSPTDSVSGTFTESSTTSLPDCVDVEESFSVSGMRS